MWIHLTRHCRWILAADPEHLQGRIRRFLDEVSPSKHTRHVFPSSLAERGTEGTVDTRDELSLESAAVGIVLAPIYTAGPWSVRESIDPTGVTSRRGHVLIITSCGTISTGVRISTTDRGSAAYDVEGKHASSACSISIAANNSGKGKGGVMLSPVGVHPPPVLPPLPVLLLLDSWSLLVLWFILSLVSLSIRSKVSGGILSTTQGMVWQERLLWLTGSLSEPLLQSLELRGSMPAGDIHAGGEDDRWPFPCCVVDESVGLDAWGLVSSSRARFNLKQTLKISYFTWEPICKICRRNKITSWQKFV